MPVRSQIYAHLLQIGGNEEWDSAQVIKVASITTGDVLDEPPDLWRGLLDFTLLAPKPEQKLVFVHSLFASWLPGLPARRAAPAGEILF